jgi:hypothetical protein
LKALFNLGQEHGEITQQFECLAVARAFKGLFVIVHGRDRGW